MLDGVVRLVLMALLATMAQAYTIKGYVAGVIPGDLPSTQVVLTELPSAIAQRAYLSSSGNFTFQIFEDGLYLLELESTTLTLPWRYRLDVIDASIAIHQVYYGHSIESLGPSEAYPIAIRGIQRPQFLDRSPQFSYTSMLKVPAVYMSLATVLMAIVLPHIVKNIDPDAVAGLQQRMAEPQAQEKKKKPVK